MSNLEPLAFPLHGSRLIEASAGTGKTYTIAALYLRLVLGHGSKGADGSAAAGDDGQGGMGMDAEFDPDFDLAFDAGFGDAEADFAARFDAGAGPDLDGAPAWSLDDAAGEPASHGAYGGAQGGGEAEPSAYLRPLMPPEILVMTFTRAATRELSNRVRERLVQAAAYFRGEARSDDPYLAALADSYADEGGRALAAHRLVLAAETMDEAAIFTIDAWCQRMLREHAFDSGSLFDEELVSDERGLFEDAAHDYWRQHVYPLGGAALAALLSCFKDVEALKRAVRELVPRADGLDQEGDDAAESLGALIVRIERRRQGELARIKAGWAERADAMENWIAAERDRNPKCFHGSKMRADTLAKWFDALRAWALDPQLHTPALTEAAWNRLAPDGIVDAFSKGFSTTVPACFDAMRDLRAALDAVAPLAHALLRHAAGQIARRVAELKRRNRQFGFADMLARLKEALEGPNGAALRQRILDQFPVAMVDEFQDTSPDQYRIFDLLYRVADNDPARGLFLIGDPKQSIYGFRGADIHSYLAARRATAGRHYQLGTNYRSTAQLVRAVNRLFQYAEGEAGDPGQPGYAAGAFRFRKDGDNPLPFEAVAAAGRRQQLVGVDGPFQALAVCSTGRDDLRTDDYRAFFAEHCAEHIVTLLNDARVGFGDPGGGFQRLVPADIAILVRDRREAAAVRHALARRRVASVYLSDQDSVLDSEEAADMLRWLQAVANPLDGALARAAFATATCALPLAALARLASDEQAWENRVEQLKNLHQAWQRQGVLAMLRRFIHELGLPSQLLAAGGGERRLTNLLHLAELLQEASRELDGEQALIRWFAEQIDGMGEAGDERVLRLESDAELVKVVTVHKSKGLEYPLVYLPFAVTARKTERRNRAFFEYVDDGGARRIDLGLGDAALEAVDRARLEEDLRLLYVALTRARHFLWLGVAAVAAGRKGENRLHESALGYLLTGGEAIPAASMGARWQRLRGDVDGIALHDLQPLDGFTVLARQDARPELLRAAPFEHAFERNWSIGSFTSLTRHTVAPPTRPQEENLMEEAEAGAVEPVRVEDAPWHRFPRGATPGNFLHEQLEWMAQEGFDRIDDAEHGARLAQRIERAGWANRLDDALAWLRALATTPLPPLDAALADLAREGTLLPEMEFWFPSRSLDVGALDRLCRARLLGDVARPTLPERQLHGMLKGFTDLVFEHRGRYWVLDYKSNALGPGDAAYTQAAMAAGMAGHRYDIQGAIYLLALHRLLRARLGAAYDPATQLGGALFLFLRGIASPATHGCFLLAPDLELLDGLDGLLGDGERT
ncbi:exodeoxyribonuclease V subunit beta [Massilia forsythiae]|uniref:RecBCD enzyme subunit RecB n=1 Tax=Massilia forsythiae TaxID=2728020 RepID=A0A7Z2ZTS5_9BURK|nr:exodeoxyribonuclease V subunit beta [Massilia forsythiae]QJE01674.1 exodeoxyribonuclease V subunit beta [Massilia forsythiae]